MPIEKDVAVLGCGRWSAFRRRGLAPEPVGACSRTTGVARLIKTLLKRACPVARERAPTNVTLRGSGGASPYHAASPYHRLALRGASAMHDFQSIAKRVFEEYGVVAGCL